MRPQKAYRKIYNAIDKCIYKGVALKKDLLPAIDKLLERCIRSLNKIDETYGWPVQTYDKNELEQSYSTDKNNFGDLMYISDRFNAPHRLFWLRYMVENELFKGGITVYEHWENEDKMKLSEWIVIDGYCVCRVPVGLDPEDPANRVAFIEKTPRVRIKQFTDIESEQHAWEFGPKGCGGSGDAQEQGIYGFYQPSREWCDVKLRGMGYILPKVGE